MEIIKIKQKNVNFCNNKISNSLYIAMDIMRATLHNSYW